MGTPCVLFAALMLLDPADAGCSDDNWDCSACVQATGSWTEGYADCDYCRDDNSCNPTTLGCSDAVAHGTSCSACGPGKYRSGTSCRDCQEGRYKAGTNTQTSCSECPAGKSSYAGSDSSYDCDWYRDLSF